MTTYNPVETITAHVAEIDTAASGLAAGIEPADMRAAVVAVRRAAGTIRYSAAFVPPKNRDAVVREIRVAAERVSDLAAAYRSGDYPPDGGEIADYIRRTGYDLTAAEIIAYGDPDLIPTDLTDTALAEIRVIRSAARTIIVGGLAADLRRRADAVVALADRVADGDDLPADLDLTAAAALYRRLDELAADTPPVRSETLRVAAELADLLTAERQADKPTDLTE